MKIITFFLSLILVTIPVQAQLDLSLKLDHYLKKINSVQKIELSVEKPTNIHEVAVTLPETTPEVVQKKMLVSPKAIKLPALNLSAPAKAKVFINPSLKTEIPGVTPLSQIPDPKILAEHPDVTELNNITNNEYKFIQALIFLQMQKKYDIALNTFAELSEDPALKYDSILHYGISSYYLQMPSEFRYKMLHVAYEGKSTAIKKAAVQQLIDHVDALSTADIESVETLFNELNLGFKKTDAYRIKEAKYNLTKNNLNDAESTLAKIEQDSDFYPEASVLMSNLHYRKGDLSTAIKDIEKVSERLANNKKDKLNNVAFLTLARLYFQKGNYKSAYANYLKIDKSSSLWLQAMIEQAWTQILAGDYIGAAGNMFSLHTDFFKKAYAPETYSVRTVGYLNLCQYGDAISVLNNLNARFTRIQQSLINYQNENKKDQVYYELVKNWLKNTDQIQIDNVPRSFIVELARHPSFTIIQNQINNFEEEAKKFESFNTAILSRANLAKQKMAKIKENPHLNYAALELEYRIAKDISEALKKAQAAARVRAENEKIDLKKTASESLKDRFQEFTAVLTSILEQNEVLAYEIYSGAGEHIRYQMAGGEASDRNPAALTPEEKNSYKWKFKGEVWEDEIGHYRSSLTNVCPQDELAAQQTGGQ